MSWQRILEIARRQKMPMVVTDLAARDPMVILPLHIYEAIVDRSVLPTSFPDETIRIEPIDPQEPMAPTAPIMSSRTTVLEKQPLSAGPMPVERSTSLETSEISLEERFYLEPVEDGIK